MKQTFIVEIILPNLPNAGFSECEIERALRAWRRQSFSEQDAESFTFHSVQKFDKPLISNVLPFTKITLDHTEEKGFHLAEEQIKKEKFPLRLQGIAWERAYESEDDTLREQR